MPSNTNQIEKRLWDAADTLRANSNLQASEYSRPVLGLIFLRYADHKFAQTDQKIRAERSAKSGQRLPPLNETTYQARGALFVPDQARFSHLVALPEGSNLGRAINHAMKAIEELNPKLKDVLPKNYNRLGNDALATLLRLLNSIQVDAEGDVLGKIYEYFLGNFAMSEGRRGGQFFTPTSIVKLIVEILEPYHGVLLDPACGSGGMFVQSAHFIERHQRRPSAEISLYGQELVLDIVRLAQMNLAVHGLEANIRQGNSYYEDIHHSLGRFDFVMANPPFNVNRIDKDRIKDDPRFPFGLPTADNGNYIWIQIFHSALALGGRAGFVMANSASDARGSELEIRRKLLQSGAVDVMVSIGPNFFYTVTLPCTLWFLDRGKPSLPPAAAGGTQGGYALRSHDTVLFLDARTVFTQVDRAHRELGPEQLEFLANVVRLYRGKEPESEQGSAALMAQHFPDGAYRDVPGLCKVATVKEIEAQGWSLNPGRYVGVGAGEEEVFNFAVRLAELQEKLEGLNAEAQGLQESIAANISALLEHLQ